MGLPGGLHDIYAPWDGGFCGFWRPTRIFPAPKWRLWGFTLTPTLTPCSPVDFTLNCQAGLVRKGHGSALVFLATGGDVSRQWWFSWLQRVSHTME